VEAVDLRKKWADSITKVDESFLRMVDDLYKSYTDNKMDFFDDLPKEIQDLLLKSKEEAKHENIRNHEDVLAEFREKYNLSR